MTTIGCEIVLSHLTLSEKARYEQARSQVEAYKRTAKPGAPRSQAYEQARQEMKALKQAAKARHAADASSQSGSSTLEMPPLEPIGAAIGLPATAELLTHLDESERARYTEARTTSRENTRTRRPLSEIEREDMRHAQAITAILMKMARKRHAKAHGIKAPGTPLLGDELDELAAMTPDEMREWDRSHLDNHCAACKKAVQSPAELKMCQGCKGARYCSGACQRAHWSDHGPACGPKPTLVQGPVPSGIGAEVATGPRTSMPADEWRGYGGGYYGHRRYGYRPASVAGGILGGLAGGLAYGLTGGYGYGYPYGGYGYGYGGYY